MGVEPHQVFIHLLHFRILEMGSVPHPFSRNSEINTVECGGVSFGDAKWAVPMGILREKPLLPAEPFLPPPHPSQRLSGTEWRMPLLQM